MFTTIWCKNSAISDSQSAMQGLIWSRTGRLLGRLLGLLGGAERGLALLGLLLLNLLLAGLFLRLALFFLGLCKSAEHSRIHRH